MKFPYSTVLRDDIFNDKIIIRDLEFNGCGNGSIYGTIQLWRGIYNPSYDTFTNLYVTNMYMVYFGELGCNS